MSPRRLWAIAAAFGGVIMLVSSPALTFPGLVRGLPLGGLGTVAAAIALAMTFGVLRAPQQKEGE